MRRLAKTENTPARHYRPRPQPSGAGPTPLTPEAADPHAVTPQMVRHFAANDAAADPIPIPEFRS